MGCEWIASCLRGGKAGRGPLGLSFLGVNHTVHALCDVCAFTEVISALAVFQSLKQMAYSEVRSSN